MNAMLIGIDIGGTKCAVTLGQLHDTGVTLVDSRSFPTPGTPAEALQRLSDTTAELAQGHALEAIGVSCGGPLDSARGLICSPPNLPGWDNIDVVTPLHQRFAVPVALQNDANAGALAEWLWGAGRGCKNVLFLTFGTGIGAGLVLDGRLYSGTNGLAGEVGHIRLAPDGPVGYGKAGSLEGFCSGGGIARLAQQMAQNQLDRGEAVGYAPTYADLPTITAERVGHAAQAGDPLALEVWQTVARRLGQGLAILIDAFNPERIILGSIYLRQRPLLEQTMLEVVRVEALAESLSVCTIVPAELGEQVGSFASLAIAYSTRLKA